LRQFGLYGAYHAADFGAGAGHFTFAAAPRLEGGRLYAVDIDKETLGRLLSDAKELGHRHVHGIWGDASRIGGVPLADETLDRAIAANILFQTDDRDALVREMKRLLKPTGKILVIDWHDAHSYGPYAKHKFSPADAHALFSKHGFVKDKDIDAGDYHYGMIFTRP